MNWNSFKYKRATIRVVVIAAFMVAAFFLGRSLGETVQPAEASIPPAVVIENNNYYSPERPTVIPDPTPEVSNPFAGPTRNALADNGPVIVDERVK